MECRYHTYNISACLMYVMCMVLLCIYNSMVLPLSHKTEKETKKGIHGGNNMGDHRVPVKSKY